MILIKRNSGFSLVEILIIAVIVGILSTIAIPNYARTMERSKCSQAMEILTNMRQAALLYFNENETFSGMDAAALETQANADFDTTDENSYWNFSVTAAGATSFTLQGIRTASAGHPNNGLTITVNETGVWGGTYDRDNPVSGF